MLVLGRKSLAERTGISNGKEAEPGNMADDDLDSQGGVGASVSAAAEALRESLDELDGDLRRLLVAVSGAALEDFGLDKVVDFSPTGGPSARAKLAVAALLCGSYEALMQGSLCLIGRPTGVATSASPRGRPTAASVRALLRLFDRRQTLLGLVRPSLPTPAQQRVKKAGGGSSSGGIVNSLGGDGESAAGVGGGVAGAGPGVPGFSAGGCFGLTLYPGGMPCLGMTFVEGILAVLNTEPDDGDDGDETEGDTERDPGVVDMDTEDSPTEVGASVALCIKIGLGQERVMG